MYINTLRGSGDSNFSCSGSHCTVPPGARRTAWAGRSAPWRGPGCPLPARGPLLVPGARGLLSAEGTAASFPLGRQSNRLYAIF